jgi:hypothetical protein
MYAKILRLVVLRGRTSFQMAGLWLLFHAICPPESVHTLVHFCCVVPEPPNLITQSQILAEYRVEGIGTV